jgi:hypothetical protein
MTSIKYCFPRVGITYSLLFLFGSFDPLVKYTIYFQDKRKGTLKEACIETTTSSLITCTVPDFEPNTLVHIILYGNKKKCATLENGYTYITWHGSERTNEYFEYYLKQKDLALNDKSSLEDQIILEKKRLAEEFKSHQYYILAKSLDNGTLVPEQNSACFQWYERAAIMGQVDAQYCVGECYELGKGVKRNSERAFYWYRKAALAGYPVAQCTVGCCYYEGIGVPMNRIEAIKWYTLAALQQCAEAQHNIGLCYLQGHGVEKNATLAAQWFLQAAKGGFARAKYNLGVCYYEGIGVRRNVGLAIYWFEEASKQEEQDTIKKQPQKIPLLPCTSPCIQDCRDLYSCTTFSNTTATATATNTISANTNATTAFSNTTVAASQIKPSTLQQDTLLYKKQESIWSDASKQTLSSNTFKLLRTNDDSDDDEIITSLQAILPPPLPKENQFTLEMKKKSSNENSIAYNQSKNTRISSMMQSSTTARASHLQESKKPNSTFKLVFTEKSVIKIKQ